MDMETILIVAHIIGTVLGVGGATMIEVVMNKSLTDGKVSDDEHVIFGSVYTFMRVGLIIALISGFGFLLLYKFEGETSKLYDPVLWVKLIALLTIALNTILLQMHKISLYWGSALSFISWWYALLLGIFLTNDISYSFFPVLTVYAFSLALGAHILHSIRNRLTSN